MPRRADELREVTPYPKTFAEKKKGRRGINPVSDRKRKKRTEAELAGVFEDVLCRSHGVCELLRDRPATDMHHRRRAGRVDSVENLLHLSSYAHHQLIHANPDWSYRHGLLLGAGDSPDLLIVGCDVSCPIDHRPPTGWLEPLPREDNP